MLATELARRKIPVRVNAIAPGVFESNMTRELPDEGGELSDKEGEPSDEGGAPSDEGGKVLDKGELESVARGMHPVPMGRPGR